MTVQTEHDNVLQRKDVEKATAENNNPNVGPLSSNDNHNDENDNNDHADDVDDTSTVTSTNTSNQLVEYRPPKSLVIVWILMAAELGFNLGTSIIAFASTIGSNYCCGYTIYLGPLPLTTTIPFFFLILTELGFLARAILLTLFPSKFGVVDDDDHDSTSNNNEEGQEGFEVKLQGGRTTTKSTNTEQRSQHSSSSRNNMDGDDEGQTSDEDDLSTADLPVTMLEKQTVNVEHISKDDIEKAKRSSDSTSQKELSKHASQKKKKMNVINGEPQYTHHPRDDDPDNDGRQLSTSKQPRRRDHRRQQSFLTRFCCCCLRWNAKMVLTVLNFLTLANPFFGCLIAWMLLYQSDKAEAFLVLGLEGISIILHFVSVRLEGGLRTWWSRIIHSITIVPFLITVILMLVYIREGGVCYVVEDELFKFSGCEVCEDGQPPVDGRCGDVELSASGIVEEVQNFDITNLAALAERGAQQTTYCSSDVNFCFYPF